MVVQLIGGGWAGICWVIIMSEFVDYTKRGVTLPNGCKDLADVLALGQPQASAPKAPGPLEELPKVTHGQRSTGGVAQVERHLSRLFESRSELSTLMISSAAEELTLMFYLRGTGRVFVLILIASEARLERAVRRFFEKRGVPPVQCYPIPKQQGGGLGWGLVFPMPSLTAEAALVTSELFRNAGVAGEGADFHFRYYQPVRG